jgi:hypothetical protein
MTRDFGVFGPLLLLVALASGGCYLEQHRPLIEGVVLDAQARPLGGVAVGARTLEETGPQPPYRTRSDGQGRFRIPRQRYWNVWLPMTRPLFASTVVAACRGATLLAVASVGNRDKRVHLVLAPAPAPPDARLVQSARELCGAE